MSIKLNECMSCGGRIEHYIENNQVVVECRGDCQDYQMMRCNLDIYDPDVVADLLSYKE